MYRLYRWEPCVNGITSSRDKISLARKGLTTSKYWMIAYPRAIRHILASDYQVQRKCSVVASFSRNHGGCKSSQESRCWPRDVGWWGFSALFSVLCFIRFDWDKCPCEPLLHSLLLWLITINEVWISSYVCWVSFVLWGLQNLYHVMNRPPAMW